ncbi:hypothetical protein HY004_01825 [Candidatus Saccharibacteria bacterium]|nr:hypothetical protein [Candidatus Saccharibacteria bacterium]
MSKNINKSSLSPAVAERLFVALIFVLCILLVANFTFVTGMLRAQRTSLDHKKIDLEAVKNKQEIVKKLDASLKSQANIIEKTRLTMANIGISSDFETRLDPKKIQYETVTFQEQFIYDAQNYARQSGITIDDITFPVDASASTPSASGGAPAASTPPASAGAVTPQTGEIKLPSSVQATKIQIGFGDEGKISYRSFLKFLKLLEDNNVRMHISDMQLTPNSDDKSMLSQANLSITIFSRKQ